MGQHSETVSVGRKGTRQCCGPQCPAPFTRESTTLVPPPQDCLFSFLCSWTSTLPLAGRLQAPQPLPVSPSFTWEQLLKRGWLDSVSQLALELGVGALSFAQTFSWSDRCHSSVTTS